MSGEVTFTITNSAGIGWSALDWFLDNPEAAGFYVVIDYEQPDGTIDSMNGEIEWVDSRQVSLRGMGYRGLIERSIIRRFEVPC